MNPWLLPRQDPRPAGLRRWWLALGILATCPLLIAAQDGDVLTAVAASTSGGYARHLGADGVIENEYYAFGEGGYFRGSIRDDSIDHMEFIQLARTLAGPLALQHYVPTRAEAETKLLIMVYWGTTTGTADPRVDTTAKGAPPLTIPHSGAGPATLPITSGAFDVIHTGANPGGPELMVTDLQSAIHDAQNAALLGYDSSMILPAGYQLTARRAEHDDLVEEIEHNRYFVVLLAYDFQLLWREHKTRKLWEARFSIRQERNRFDDALPRMAAYSAQYFGENTDGLIRRPLPETRVEIGTARLVASPPSQGGAIGNPPLIAASRLPGPLIPTPVPTPALPEKLSHRIADYQEQKASLQAALSAALLHASAGEETRLAIDRFHSDHAPQIAALQRDLDAIRGELADLAASPPNGAVDLTIADLRRQFSESVTGSKLGDPLFAHQ